jgi:DNA-binding response OmpR family regulator
LRLLIVEDEPAYARLIRAYLETNGFLCDVAGDLGDALAMLEMTPFALVLLDRRLPDGDALRSIHRIRAARPGIRVMMLTALDAVDDRVSGLEAGADDYLTKPFAPSELLARVRASLRRPGMEANDDRLTCGGIEYDRTRRQAMVNGAAIVLQRRELALLEMLVERCGRVVLRDTLADTLYGLDDDVQSNALDVQVSRLRRRLQELNSGAAIVTVRGVGYMLNPL